MSRKKKSSAKKLISFVIAVIVLLIGAFTFLNEEIMQLVGNGEGEQSTMGETLDIPDLGETDGKGILFHFINVGQGDAILVTTPEGNMLVDTSIKGQQDELAAYLASVNVTELKYLVLTHPDADHIGNAQYIVENYPVETVYMTNRAATSKTYTNLITALENSSADVVCPSLGESFDLGGLRSTFLAPVEEYDDANEMSLVLKCVYGSNSIMLTGDAEHISEGDMLEKWSKDSFKCDILKAGHHGSSSSTTEEFLNAVAPSVAVISCGEGNTYGHPHEETMDRFAERKITVYRTDIDGNIVAKLNGTTIEITTESGLKE